MSYYRHHIFFCTNQRAAGEDCCQNFNTQDLRDYAKAEIKRRKLAGKGGVRVNTAGCLDRCPEGPVAVVYPEAVWYTFVDKEDIDEIIEQHLVNGQIVERLKLSE